MGYAVLEITDGTTTIKLAREAGLNGFHLVNWQPAIAGMKGGGVWGDSPIGNGRRLIMRNWSNVIETFELDISGFNQNDVIQSTQELRRLLEKARDHWTPNSTVGAVWIKAQSDCEDNPRYAYIYDYNAPEDDNPYGTGFAGNAPYFSGWILSIERGHWQSEVPGTSVCVPLYTRKTGVPRYGPNLVLNPGFETAGGGGADVFGSWTESVGDGTIARSTTVYQEGAASAALTNGALNNTYIQQNIAVTAGATYSLNIFNRFNSINHGRYEVLNITAGGSIVAATVLPVPYAGFDTWYLSNLSFTVPIGCNTIGLVLRCPTGGTGTAWFDYVTLRRVLDPVEIGEGESCDYGPIVVNSTAKSHISDMFYYDASAGTYSANLLGSATPYNLFPNPLAVGDYLYVGMDASLPDAGPVLEIIFNLAAVINGPQLLVRVWDGATWSNSGIYTYYPTEEDYMNGAGLTMRTRINIGTPAATVVNGVYGYWVRFAVNNIGAGGQPQVTKDPYTLTIPSMYLTGEDIQGDIPALMKVSILGAEDVDNGVCFRGIFWSRSVSRGALFNPYINLSDIQVPSGITVTANQSDFAAYGRSPTGRTIYFSPAAGAANDNYTVTIASPLCNHYFGTFRVFLHGIQVGGAAGDIGARLTLTSNISQVSEMRRTTRIADEWIDMGRFVLPARGWTGEAIRQIEFSLRIERSAGAANFRAIDLILVPIDECAVEIIPVSDEANTSFDPVTTTRSKEAVITSLDPRAPVKASAVHLSDGALVYNGAFLPITSNEVVLPPREDQMVGVVWLDRGYFYLPSLIKIQRVERYLSMRGEE